MKNNTKIKLMKGIAVLTLATSISLSSPAIAYAKDLPKQGSFVIVGTEQAEENAKYNKYIVKEGDNLSRISERISRKVYGIEPTTKYWPVLAFMNDYPRVAQPGDEIIFPTTLEEMEARLSYLKKTGLFAKYVQNNNIYKKKFTVSDLLHDIYSSQVCVDQDFINQYLETLGLTGIYNENSVITSTNDLFLLTEWIPSLPQMYPDMDIWSLFDLHYTEEDSWMFNNPDAEVKTK